MTETTRPATEIRLAEVEDGFFAPAAIANRIIAAVAAHRLGHREPQAVALVTMALMEELYAWAALRGLHYSPASLIDPRGRAADSLLEQLRAKVDEAAIGQHVANVLAIYQPAAYAAARRAAVEDLAGPSDDDGSL